MSFEHAFAGLGMVTPLASGVESTWRRLIAKECGVRALRAEDLKVAGLQNVDALQLLGQMPSQVVAAVPHGSATDEFDSATWLQGKVCFRFVRKFWKHKSDGVFRSKLYPNSSYKKSPAYCLCSSLYTKIAFVLTRCFVLMKSG